MALLTTTAPLNSSNIFFFSKQSLNFSKPLSSSLFFPTQKPAKPIALTKPFSSQTDPPPEPIKITDEWGEKTDPESESRFFPSFDLPDNINEWNVGGFDSGNDDAPNVDPPPEPIKITDEGEEKTDPEPESRFFPDFDLPDNINEWNVEGFDSGKDDTPNVDPFDSGKDDPEIDFDGEVGKLKLRLVDSVSGSGLGFKASPEVRGEVLELVTQLEALNPTSKPVESSGLLNGNWVLVYTAFSELLPLLVAPLLKVEKISKSIDTSNRTIVNSTTFSSSFVAFPFSATASFEVQNPSRIQVKFQEGTFQPPEIKFNVEIPENLDILGQQIDLVLFRLILNPIIQGAAANISETISGLPPLKFPILGDCTKSWLVLTYLDDELLISRGDSGLFVLVKEGGPLLFMFQRSRTS